MYSPSDAALGLWKLRAGDHGKTVHLASRIPPSGSALPSGGEAGGRAVPRKRDCPRASADKCRIRIKMAPPTPLLAVRGSEGLYMLRGSPHFTEHTTFQRDSGKNAKVFTFSRDGSFFALGNGEKVNIVNVNSQNLLHSFDLPKAVCLEFSPKSNVLVTWQLYTTAKDGAGEPNLQLFSVKNGKCLKSFIQKKSQNWCPCWSDDESLCARSVNNELHFFENNDFSTIANKLHLQKINDFVLSPGDQPTKVAVYVPGSKGAPSFVRLYQYPNFEGSQSALANKSFFKADKVKMLWNSKATAMLVIASTEVDKTGASYYGEQTLHYIATNGETAVVQLPKNGPIYDAAWNPNATEFCVVYEVQPNAELWQVSWQPFLDGVFPAKPVTYHAVPSKVLNEEPKTAPAYRPPALRNKPVTSTKLHEDEPPQNMRTQSKSGDKPLSKTALKNQKKHEAKKVAKQEARAKGNQEITSAPPVQNELSNTISSEISGDPELEKKIKNLKKKLKAIEQLKEQAAAGKQLEKNQMEKIQKEAILLKELEDLELGV
ncbi:eukaryotic translation initiation factor 2A [Crotalus adamanteus]|uniref:Eukaryotic translation initiation factor 2A n=1 Tax=Crotalus adamanteus TaxID=8729 RepID=A0AAW1BGJ9_CROAD